MFPSRPARSMEEAEFLCRRVGIMVDGAFACLGPPARLRARFGRALQAEVKAAAPAAAEPHSNPAAFSASARDDGEAEADAMARVAAFMADAFPGCSLVEHHGLSARFQIPLGGRNASMGPGAAAAGPASHGGAGGGAAFPAEPERPAHATLADAVAGAEAPPRHSLPPSSGALTLSEAFRRMEAGRRAAGIAEYAVGQASLDSIFNAFAGARRWHQQG